MCSGPNGTLAGSILCSAGALLGMPQVRSMVQWYLDACVSAGQDVINEGCISEATNRILERELIDDIDAYIEGGNTYFTQILKKELPKD